MNRLTQRFDELLQEIDGIIAGAQTKRDPLNATTVVFVDSEAFLSWKVKAANAIEKAAGPDAPQSQSFADAGKFGWAGNKSAAESQRAVVRAVRDDHDGGFLVSTRALARAEVFDTELDQAKELLSQGYSVPAAVIARTVLETAMRGLCEQYKVDPGNGKLDFMNAELVKKQVYSVVVQKNVTYMSGVGNSAAHGKHDQYKASDVQAMIDGVTRFLLDFPTA
jgi:hypothetical protein